MNLIPKYRTPREFYYSLEPEDPLKWLPPPQVRGLSLRNHPLFEEDEELLWTQSSNAGSHQETRLEDGQGARSRFLAPESEEASQQGIPGDLHRIRLQSTPTSSDDDYDDDESEESEEEHRHGSREANDSDAQGSSTPLTVRRKFPTSSSSSLRKQISASVSVLPASTATIEKPPLRSAMSASYHYMPSSKSRRVTIDEELAFGSSGGRPTTFREMMAIREYDHEPPQPMAFASAPITNPSTQSTQSVSEAELHIRELLNANSNIEVLKQEQFTNQQFLLFHQAFPIWSRVLSILGVWVPTHSQHQRAYRIYQLAVRTLWTLMAPIMAAFELVFFNGQFSSITALIFLFIVVCLISLWFIHLYYQDPFFEMVLINSVCLRKRHYFRTLEKKTMILTFGTFGLITAGGCALIAVKYLTLDTIERFLFAFYLLYIPFLWHLVAALMTYLLTCDILQVIINDTLQIIQTPEIKDWTIVQLTQLQLKIVRRRVEAAVHHCRFYLLLMLISAVTFMLFFGALILASPPELLNLIILLLLFGLSILFLFTVLFPGSSVTDRGKKVIKYGNIGMASRFHPLHQGESLSFLRFVSIERVEFKVYGLRLTRATVMKAMVLTFSFLFVGVARLKWLFNF